MTNETRRAAAYGGRGWRPRAGALGDEIGTHWGTFGVRAEWTRLRAVLLHPPGPELGEVDDPDALLMLDRPDPEAALREHESLARVYRKAGIEVRYVAPPEGAGGAARSPNLIYVADLLFMTPEGAVLARPAGEARAGEERWVQRALADAGVPVLRAVGGTGTFEGADAMWLDSRTVLLGRGLRTNAEGARQVARVLEDLGVETVVIDLPAGAMHLMGQLRIVDRDLAFAREGRLSDAGLRALRERGYDVRFFPDEEEMDRGFAHNAVVLGPREILMPGGCPLTQRFYEEQGVTCRTIPMREIPKAAGAIGCLTGVLRRED
jgi:arginine deiminase